MRDDVNVSFVSTNYGPMWAPVIASWLRVMAYTSRYMTMEHVGTLGGAGVTDRLYTSAAENQLVNESLKAEPEFTHIFMTESDMILPHDIIIKLLDLDVDMASGVYFLRAAPAELRGQPCLYKKSFEKPYKYKDGSYNQEYMYAPVNIFNETKAFRTEAAGLGCVLIKREVFETIKQPWFCTQPGSLEANGYGSDMYFYAHARKAGFDLWIEPTVQCGQIDYYINGVADYHWQLENNPKFPQYGFILGGDHVSHVADKT